MAINKQTIRGILVWTVVIGAALGVKNGPDHEALISSLRRYDEVAKDPSRGPEAEQLALHIKQQVLEALSRDNPDPIIEAIRQVPIKAPCGQLLARSITHLCSKPDQLPFLVQIMVATDRWKQDRAVEVPRGEMSATSLQWSMGRGVTFLLNRDDLKDESGIQALTTSSARRWLHYILQRASVESPPEMQDVIRKAQIALAESEKDFAQSEPVADEKHAAATQMPEGMRSAQTPAQAPTKNTPIATGIILTWLAVITIVLAGFYRLFRGKSRQSE